MDIEEAYVALTALDAADIGAIKIAHFSESFLREFLSYASFSDTPTKGFL